MKQNISTLMDGELFEDEAEPILDRIRREYGSKEDWDIYHLIGDALRQPDHIHCDVSAKVHEHIREEPFVLAPRRRATKQKMYAIAWSAAATLAAVGVVGWMSLQIAPEPVQQMARRQTDVRSASAPVPSGPDDYLMAHQEFSPSTEMNGGASYVRTASYRDAR